MWGRGSAVTVAFGALIVAPAPVCAVDEFLARSGFYGPRIQQKYAKPTFRWEVWADKVPVQSVEMQVNGEKVDAKYDASTRSILFTPLVALTPGVHKVHCRVTFTNQQSFSRDWDTPVGDGALKVLPEPSAGQKQAVEIANELRSGLSLPPFVMDDRLNEAAQSHASYLAKNNMRGHGERPADGGFLGADPASRLESLGWGGSSWETLAYVFANDREAVRNTFDAPYHRVPFMQPGILQFGYGSASQKATAEIEGTHDTAVICSPADGQTNVPLSWSTIEHPNPLDSHPEVKEPVGYPIVLADFEPPAAKLQVTSAKLTGPNGEVRTLLNTPESDAHLTNALILIPIAVLKPSTKYTVSVQAIGLDGKAIERTWSFQTAAK